MKNAQANRRDTPTSPSGARAAAWVLLLGFMFLVASARGVYEAMRIEPSGRFEALAGLGSLPFFWNWLREQCRPYGQGFPMDMGLFLPYWMVLFPYYLWRHERWRGLAKCGLLVGAWAGAQGWSLMVAWLL